MGAQGVGLLRTEFLLTGRASLRPRTSRPNTSAGSPLAFPDQTVVIRSFDLGGDKFPAAFKAPVEANPFLGWRSIRVCLDQPEVFRPQIRAVLRAAAGHDLQLMLPLVTTVQEVEEAREMMVEEARRCRRRACVRRRSVPVGVMVETPAAVIMADRLAEVSAFFSVGTNDLTQYTMAVDRGNARLAKRFTPHDPSIVRQLHRVVEAGGGGNSGERVRRDGLGAAERGAAAGLGYDRLSVSPPALPLVKWVVRTVPRSRLGARPRPRSTRPAPRRFPTCCARWWGSTSTSGCWTPISALPGRGRVASLPPGKSSV